MVTPADPFYAKVAAAPKHTYDVLSISGNRVQMLRLLEWAREQRAQGVHVGIFFVKDTLTVHTPRADTEVPQAFIEEAR